MEAQAVRDGLAQGDMLNWYRIDRVLGRGGFGITYLATDTNLKTQVAVKEYLPTEVAERDSDSYLKPLTPEVKHIYLWGLKRFIAEAQTLARFSHPNIVRVLSVFEGNGTAYMVMEYQRGSNLKTHLKHQSLVTENRLKALFRPIIDGLRLVHQSGFIHRDIKPSNIMVRSDGSPVLIDFGSARKSYDSQTRTLTSMVSVGYTPLEQYSDSSDDKQGPWTDIYACGAVLHFAITGKPPPDATQRGSALLNRSPDPLKPLSESAAGRFSQPFLRGVDWALGFAIDDRPKTLDDWSASLFATGPVAVPGLSRHKPGHNTAANASGETVIKPAPVRSRTPAQLAAAAVHRAQKQAPAPEDTYEWDMSFLDDMKTAPPAAIPKPSRKRKPGRMVAITLVTLLAGTAGFLYYKSQPPSANTTRAIAGSPPVPTVQIAEPVAGVMPNKIGGFPVDEANKKLAKLASAVAQADLAAVGQLGVVSAQSLSLLSILFRQFDAVKVDVSPLETQSGQHATATLRLLQFTRSSGTVAYPARAFESLAVEVTQSDSGVLQLAL